MKISTRAEYSVFGMNCPINSEPERMSQISDEYLLYNENFIVKIRNDNLFKFKIITIPGEIDIFHCYKKKIPEDYGSVQTIYDVFIEEPNPKIRVEKNRKTWNLGKVVAHFTEIMIEDLNISSTHFSLTSKDPQSIKNTLEKLRINKINQNYASFLQEISR